MPNVDKIVKNVMHEISDGKAAVRETMTSALRNQEVIIVQNRQIIDLLEKINGKLFLQREEGGTKETECVDVQTKCDEV